MKQSPDRPLQDRWMLIALGVAAAGVILAALVWRFPTSPLVWLLAAGFVIFGIVWYFHPRFRYRRWTSFCLSAAGALAFVPTITARVSLEGLAIAEFASDSSPLLVIAFLGAALVFAWVDEGKPQISFSKVRPSSGISNTHIDNSPAAVVANAKRDVNIYQRFDAESVRALSEHFASDTVRSDVLGQPDANCELLWRLFDEIKSLRNQLESEAASQLTAELNKRIEKEGTSWSKELRTEALLILAEEEQANIVRARYAGGKVDITKFKAFVEELHDV